MKIVFATNNLHKIAEVKRVVGEQLDIITLQEAGLEIDIEEPYDTLEENAREKCEVVHRLTGLSCFSEDSGLEVEALNGSPGVKSARYAGDHRSDSDNIVKLLDEMALVTNRRAQFRTVIAMIWENELQYFEGVCKGTILTEARGGSGFGYDPVFVPEGSNKSFAEMNLDEKNAYSHRRKATDRVVVFLQQRLESLDKQK